MRRFLRGIFLLSTPAFVMGLMGCGAEFNAYEGPVLDLAQVAVVSGDSGTGTVLITSVDRRERIGSWKPPTVEVRVRSGVHDFGVAPKTPTPELSVKTQRRLRFKVDSGRKYLISLDRKVGTYAVHEVTGTEVPFFMLD